MFLASVTLAAALANASASAAQSIPNPVQLTYQVALSAKVASIDCWSEPGQRGTWLKVTGSTYTSQEALLYNLPQTLPLAELRQPAILYCIASDGQPGFIRGAPKSLMLSAGTRIDVFQTAQIVTDRSVGGKIQASGGEIALQPGVEVRGGPNGVTVQTAHHMTVYPAGATVTVGSGYAVSYTPPTANLRPGKTHVEGGCTVDTIDASASTHTTHFATDCYAVLRSQTFAKR